MDDIQAIAQLIDGWCDRRALGPLREVLQAWPSNGLTDGVALLADALEKVRAFAGHDLAQKESETVDAAISALRRAIHER